MSDQHNAIEEDRIVQAVDGWLVRRLFQFLKPYWVSIVFASILSIAIAGLNLLGPWIVKVAIDEHISVGDTEGVLHLSAWYMLVLVVLFLVEYAREWVTAKVGQHAMFDLRRAIFGHLQKLSLPFFDRNPVGRIMTRVTSDVAALNELFTQGLTTLAGDLLILVAIAAILLYQNWVMALMLFATAPLLAMAGWWFRCTVREGYREVRLRLSMLNAYLQENLSGIRTVQAYNRQGLNLAQFVQLNEDHRMANMKTVFAHAVFIPVVELISALALAAIIWYGGIASLDQSITVGTIVLFIQLCQKFYQPIKDLSDKFNILQTAMASSERIFKLLDEKPDVASPANPTPFHGLKETIEFKDVSFAYKNEDWVLRDVSFTINRGETIALVGSTGSGKTTITNLLARFYDIQKGAILVDGVDIRQMNPTELRQRMAIVLQDNFLFTGDIASNIRLGNSDITDQEMKQAAEFVNAAEFIQSLPNGYNQEVLERGATLSVGQKQLLAFARALAFNPEILILDEATASIDTETELLIQDALDKLLTTRTSIVIAHRLSTIQKADRILVMHHGRIRESGTHGELLQLNGLYRKLYDLQYSTVETRQGSLAEG